MSATDRLVTARFERTAIELDDPAKNTTVDRALRVMEVFLLDDEELSLSDIARVLNLDKSVIHRILATLVRRRFIEQDSVTKRYRVGLRTWEIAQHYAASSPLEQLAEEALDGVLADHSYATGYFATLDGDEVVILKTVRGPGPINIYIDPGTRLPAALTATGRVLLAHLPASELDPIFDRLSATYQARRAGAGETTLADLLDECRARGYSINRGEYYPGIGTVAMCVRDAGGYPVAAISVDFPIAEETDALWESIPREVERAVAGLERVLSSVGETDDR